MILLLNFLDKNNNDELKYKEKIFNLITSDIYQNNMKIFNR